MLSAATASADTLTTAETQTLIAAQFSERELSAHIQAIAAIHGWHCYAVLDTRTHAKRTLSGFPDLTLFRGKRMIIAELKTERGKLTARQNYILAQLRRIPHIEVYVWRPSDLDDVAELLSAPDID